MRVEEKGMDLLEIEGTVLCSMYEYIEDFEDDAPYTKDDVKECGLILGNFLVDLECAKHDKGKILDSVKIAIEKLNKLNEQLNGELIETEQREDLCDFIMKAVIRAGLDTEDDVTEEWREW